MVMTMYEVGGIYPHKLKSENDGGILEIADKAYLILQVTAPTKQEIKGARAGKCEFGLLMRNGIIFLTYLFDGFKVSDCPYNARLNDQIGKKITIPDVEDGIGIDLAVHLVDSKTKILHAYRMLGLGTDFSRTLKTMIEKQYQLSFNPQAYDNNLQKLYATFSSEQLHNMAQIKYQFAAKK